MRELGGELGDDLVQQRYEDGVRCGGGGSGNNASTHQCDDRAGPQRQLFDHRKDDPVKFSTIARSPQSSQLRQATKSTGDHVSAASTSSYAPSVASSLALALIPLHHPPCLIHKARLVV
jgi:hypothetical protein